MPSNAVKTDEKFHFWRFLAFIAPFLWLFGWISLALSHHLVAAFWVAFGPVLGVIFAFFLFELLGEAILPAWNWVMGRPNPPKEYEGY